MKRWRIGLLVAWFSMVGGAAGIACSSADDDDAQHADGGGGSGADDASRDGRLADDARGDVVSDAGAAADGDADAAVDDPTSACRAYVAASCTHTDYCHPPGVYYAIEGGSQTPPSPLQDCLAIEELCPEYAFGKGTTRTIAGIVACVADIEAFDCEAWNAGLAPACVAAGSLPAGAGCLSPIQCASSSCGHRTYVTPLSCGTCTDLAADGEPCGANGCVPGDSCNSGVCGPAVAQHGLDAGAPCTPAAPEQCAAPYICGDAHTCGPYGGCGASVCTSPTVCNSKTLHCDPPATFGQSCAAAYCTDASTCYEDASPPTCGALLPVSSPCTSSDQCVPTTYCSAKRLCTTKTGAVGDSCVVGSSGGSSCSGSDVCVTITDGGSVCAPAGLDPVPRNGDCAAAGAVCSNYLSCVDGTCTLPIGDCSTFDAGVRDR